VGVRRPDPRRTLVRSLASSILICVESRMLRRLSNFIGLAAALETTHGCRDRREDTDALGPTPDHDDCYLKAGWVAAGDDGGLRERRSYPLLLCLRDSQKAANLARDDRVSLTIDHDTPEVMATTGLSMAARAQAVAERDEAVKVLRMLQMKFPGFSQPLPMLSPENTKIFWVTPTVISVLDYSKGFGHTDLVTF